MNGITFFPETKDVFVDNVELCNKHFYPLVSFDLSLADKDLSGQIHVVYSNNDPYCEGASGHSSDEINDEYTRFDLIDNKLKFKGDFSFFKTNEDWIRWLEMGRKSYEENKKLYKNSELDLSETVKYLGDQPDFLQDLEWPKNDNGNKLTFICQIWSNDFVSDYCEEEIYVFYDKDFNQLYLFSQID